MDIESFQKEPIVAKVLSILAKPQVKIDEEEFARELPRYLKRNNPSLVKEEDLLSLDNSLRETQANRDRVTELQLQLEDVKYQLKRAYSVGEGYLLRKEEISGLRSAWEKESAINSVLQDLVDKMRGIDSLMERCEWVIKDLKAAYDTMWSQLDAYKTRVYRDRTTLKATTV